MLTNSQRVHLCYDLISNMLPNTFAVDNGFSTDSSQRIFYAFSDQLPRGDYQTVLYFNMTDEPYGQSLSDPSYYNSNNAQVMQQMRQMVLTIDCYSKKNPKGTAKDVLRMINSRLNSDLFLDWLGGSASRWVAIQNIENVPDLSYTLEGNVWNERRQMRVTINYRDTVELDTIVMTRVPLNLADLRNSINYQVVLMSIQTNEGDISDHSDYVGTGIYVTRGDDSNAMGYTIDIDIETSLSLVGWTAKFQLEDLTWEFSDITSKHLPLVISAEQSKQLPVGTSYGAMILYDENGLRKTVMRNIPVYIYPQLVS